MLYQRLLFLLICTSLLFGCSTTMPDNMSLRLQVVDIDVPIKSTSFVIEIQDKRTNPALVEINYSSNRKKNILPSSNLIDELKNTFQKSLTNKGYEINDPVQVKLSIAVNTLKMKVMQSNLKHTIRTQISLQAIIVHHSKRFKKSYQLKTKTEGTLALNATDIRNNLSRQLNNVIRSMLNDPELHKAFNKID